MESDNILLTKRVYVAVDFVVNKYVIDLIRKANVLGLEGKRVLDVLVDKDPDTDQVRIEFLYEECEQGNKGALQVAPGLLPWPLTYVV